MSIYNLVIVVLYHTSVLSITHLLYSYAALSLYFRVFGELAKALSFQTKRVHSANNLKTTSRLSQMMLCASVWNYYGNRCVLLLQLQCGCSSRLCYLFTTVLLLVLYCSATVMLLPCLRCS